MQQYFNIIQSYVYLHDLSSSPEKPGIPDNPLCDDGWLETYGYILLVVDGGEFGLPSLLFNGLPSEFDVVSVELCDEMCELINGWNCGYFGSMLSNRNFDIAHTNLVSLLPLIVHLIVGRKAMQCCYCQTKNTQTQHFFHSDVGKSRVCNGKSITICL